MKFSGYLKAPLDGLYMIMAGSRDGSRMRIDGRLVMLNDGVHGSTPDMYPVSLSKGLHRFELDHFGGARGARLLMQWEGPGFEPREFTSDDFMCDDTGDAPSFRIEIRSPATDGVLADNLALIHAVAGMRGHKVTEIQLFADRKIIASTTQVDEDGKAVFSIQLPRGKRSYWARLWYDSHCSVDSKNRLDLDVDDYVQEGCPWTFVRMSRDVSPISARYKDGRAAFVGDGRYIAYQEVTDDFMLTGRIADITLTTKENGVHGSNKVGLTIARKPTPGSKKVERLFSIFRTANKGMRGDSDYPNLAGTGMSASP